MQLFNYVLAASFMCFASSVPVEDRDTFILHPEITSLNEELEENYMENFPDDFMEDPMEDIEKLRKLDELIGKVEEAAMSQISLDVDNELPEIEAGLEEHDAVQLLNEGKELADVAEDLKLSSQRKEEFSIVALPYKFRRYDLNGDDYVTPVELADATGTSMEDSMEPFQRADTNGDGVLTEEELLAAPWVFDLHRKRGRHL